MPRLGRSLRVSMLPLVLLAASDVRAQLIEEPTFMVGPATLPNFGEINVSVADDGTILFIWSEYVYGSDSKRFAATQWFTSFGLPLTAPRRADSSGHVFFEPVISPDTRGGHVAAWEWIGNPFRYEIFGVLLSENGTPLGPDFRVSHDVGTPASWPAAVGLPSGSAVVYAQGGVWAQLYDATGAPRGERIAVAGGNPYRLFADALPSGGFVVAWVDLFTPTQSWARIYAGDGTPVGPAFAVSETGFVRNVAASFDGRIGALYFENNQGPDPEDFQLDLLVAEFDSAGQPLGVPIFVESLAPNVTERRPALEYDHFGNLLVAWTTYDADGAGPAFEPPMARGFTADGVPLGPTFLLADEPAYGVRIARMQERDYRGSGFVAAWSGTSSPGVEAGSATIVSLCTPDVGVCGDAILDSRCEQCDDGVANSTQPDACRPDCRVAGCGDSIVDTGEQCDDGNRVSCDGCSFDCQVEQGGQCGDGVVLVSCGETCDDGNALAGDGCSEQCLVERIPGGGSKRTDCHVEWRVNNPANEPLRDRRGAISADQVCIDNDPRCDFDGGSEGSCRMRVGICVNNTDVAGCARASRIIIYDVLTPSSSQARARSELAAVRDALLALATPLVDDTTRDLCSPWTELAIPLRGGPSAYRDARLRITTLAGGSDGTRDKDSLRLTCAPAPSD